MNAIDLIYNQVYKGALQKKSKGKSGKGCGSDGGWEIQARKLSKARPVD